MGMFLPNLGEVLEPGVQDSEYIEVLAPQNIGHLILTPVLTEHTDALWKDNQDTLMKIVKDNEFIIPEYFPPDYRAQIDRDPLLKATIDTLTPYAEQNGLFDHLAEELLKQGKPVRIIDPAYNSAAAWYRVKENWPFSTGGLLGGIFLAKTIEDLGLPTKLGRTLQAASLVSTNTIGVLSSIALNPSEVNLRRVLIAQALTQLGHSILPQDTKTAMIYPPGHWYGGDKEYGPGIKYYLDNPSERESAFQDYSRFKSGRLFSQLFQTRSFEAKNGNWIPLEGFEIS